MAHYTDEHRHFDGISFPTRRRALARTADGVVLPEPKLVTIDVEHVSVD